MPITKQAKKKLRHDRKANQKNASKRQALRTAVKQYRKKPTKKLLDQAYKLLDKAQKTNLIHKNKSSRLKSRLAKMLAKK